MKSSQRIIAIAGAAAAIMLWYVVIVFLEPMFLQSFVSPAAGVDIQGWLEEFLKSQVFATGLVGVLALLWHATALRCSGRYADRRIWWIVMWLLCITATLVLCASLLPDTQEGAMWAYILALVNGAAPFWLGTVWCTAGACKYAPLGAGRMRGFFGL